MTQAADTTAEVRPARTSARRRGSGRAGAVLAPYLQAAPMALVFLVFFVLPLAATIVVAIGKQQGPRAGPALRKIVGGIQQDLLGRFGGVEIVARVAVPNQ